MIKAVLPQETDIAIVGAGFGGLGAAIRLAQNGFDDYVVLQRSRDAGRARPPRRRGRHRVSQHVPGLPVRRALEPLLVLVRPQAGLDPQLPRAAADPRLPARLRRALRRDAEGA